MSIWTTVIPALPALISAIVGYANRRKIKEVHVLVNSKMTKALKTIAELQQQLVESAQQLQTAKAAVVAKDEASHD